jgi:hypothetical protein
LIVFCVVGGWLLLRGPGTTAAKLADWLQDDGCPSSQVISVPVSHYGRQNAGPLPKTAARAESIEYAECDGPNGGATIFKFRSATDVAAVQRADPALVSHLRCIQGSQIVIADLNGDPSGQFLASACRKLGGQLRRAGDNSP